MGTPSYEGKQVYMGLDVHREFFVASCICAGVVVKRGRMPGPAGVVISLVSKEFGRPAFSRHTRQDTAVFGCSESLSRQGLTA
jgi:hypothetical protein